MASGLPTFRDSTGATDPRHLWRSSAENLPQSLPELWAWYGELRRRAQAAEPNAGHRALAALAARPGVTVTVLTQNVDGLHQRAGSTRVLELHGSVHRSRCMNCGGLPFADRQVPTGVPACAACGGPLRPDIVLFGEALEPAVRIAAERAAVKCDVFVVVGSSGKVAPAAWYVNWAAAAGAETVLVDVAASEADRHAYTSWHRGPAEILLPDLLPALAGYSDQ